MSQVSNTTNSIYLPGLTTTINAAVTQGLQTGITAQAIAAETTTPSPRRTGTNGAAFGGANCRLQRRSPYQSGAARWSRRSGRSVRGG